MINASASPTTTPIATAANGRTVYIHLPSSTPVLIRIRSESIASIGEGRTGTSFVISSFFVTKRDLFLLLVYHLFFNTNTDIDTDNNNDTNTVPSSCDPDEALQVCCFSTDSIITTAASPTTSPVATAANSPTVYVQKPIF